MSSCTAHEVHGSIPCTGEEFGDPLPGTVKSCDCFNTGLKPATEEQTSKDGAGSHHPLDGHGRAAPSP